MLDESKLQPLLEALLLAAGKPLREEDLLEVFSEEERPSKEILRQALKDLQDGCESRGIRLMEIASGYQFQINSEWAPWVAKLWEEKAPRYSRALLETLALIAYRQPITRGEIEDIRGVSISQSIFKTLLEERDWIRVVGHREVPGKPALYATTKLFLDYFGLKTLEELPSLPEVMNLENIALMEDENIEKLMQNALANTNDNTNGNSHDGHQDHEASAFEEDTDEEEKIELLDFDDELETEREQLSQMLNESDATEVEESEELELEEEELEEINENEIDEETEEVKAAEEMKETEEGQAEAIAENGSVAREESELIDVK